MSSLTELRPPAQRRGYRVGGFVAVGAVSVLTLFAVNGILFKDPTFIDTLRVDNPTDYSIHIEIGTPESGSRLPLGAAVQRCVSDFHVVIDQGPEWVVSLRTQGRDAGQISVARDQLARDNWTIRIPDSLSGQLRAAVVPLPPDHSCPAASQFG